MENHELKRNVFISYSRHDYIDEYGNVTSTAIIKVPRGCCFNVAIDYVTATTDPTVTPAPLINVQNANLVIDRIA